MNLIVRHIEYLMLDHDCVIVPGMGAFLAHRYEASYDIDNELFNSPGRRYAFNSELSSADGLLTMSVARAMGTDSREAARNIEACVAEMRRELDITGTVNIGRIGRLEKDEDGIVTFESSPRDILTPLVNWLPEVAIAPVGSLRRQRELAIADQVEKARPHRFSRFVRTALGAAAAILIAIVVSTPVAVKDTYKASTSLPEVKIVNVTVPEVKAERQPELVATATESVSEVVADKLVSIVKAEPTQTRIDEEKSAQSPKTSLRFSELDQYVVVVASLANEHDADKYLEQQRRVNKSAYFGVIHSGRYHRVYVATGATKEQALNQARLPQIRDRYEGAWVTRR